MHPSSIDFLQYIQAELAYILKYSEGVTYDEFLNHPFLSKAFIRSFEIIGEAAKTSQMRYVIITWNLIGKFLQECETN